MCWIEAGNDVVSPCAKMGAWNGALRILQTFAGKMLQLLVATLRFHRAYLTQQ